VTSRLLSLRPLIFTGLISYSLYLWHVPILAFFAYYHITELSPLQLGAVIASIYGIAAASWMIAETPIRRKILFRSDRPFMLGALGTTTVLAVTGVLLWHSDGLPQRFSPEVRLLVDRGPLVGDARRCMTLSLREIEAGELCRYGPNVAGLPKVVVWGDSHALALLPAYQALANSHQLELYFAATSSCRPLIGVASRRLDAKSESRCSSFNAAMVQATRRLAPQLVVLNAYWTYPDTDLVPRSVLQAPENESTFSRGLQETLQRIGPSRASVCVVLDPPVMKYPVPYALAMARRRQIDGGFLAVSRASMADGYRNIERDMHSLEGRGILRTVDPKDILCRIDTCDLVLGGKPLYRDTNHLSVTGANRVAGMFESCLQGLHAEAKQTTAMRP
jgi:hypothetical protein